MPEPRQQAGGVHVAHITGGMEGGGLETLVATLVRRFAGSDIRTSVITLDGKIGRTGELIRHLTAESAALRPLPLVSMLAPLGLIRCLRRLRPDVVHIHSGAWYKGALAARRAGVRKVVFTEHGREHHDPPLQQRLDRWASRRTDVVVAVSHRLSRYLARTVGVDPKRIVTIENGVDRDVFHPGPVPEELRQRLEIPDQAIVIGSVGRLEAVKGYDRLLRVFREVRAAEDPARPVVLVLCGDGSQRGALEQLAAELGIRDRVRFAGWTQQPADLYRMLDIFVLSSISEGLSISLLEAMASGSVPVVNDVGANGEVLGSGMETQLVADGEWKLFAEALLRVVRSDSERSRLRGIGLARIAERYDVRRMLASYAELYGAPGAGA